MENAPEYSLETGNDLWIYQTYKEGSLCKIMGKGLIVIFGMLHDNVGVAI